MVIKMGPLFMACMVVFTATLVNCDGVVGKYKTEKKLHSINSFDGTRLNGISISPVSSSRDNGKFPLVIFSNSWGLPNIEYYNAQVHLAKEGYIAFAYETRGWYLAGGQVDGAGPLDQGDANVIVEYCLRTFPHVDADNIAFAGISYGAGIGLLAAANNTKVKAVVAMSGWTSMFDSFDWNYSPSLVWLDLLQLIVDVVGRPTEEFKQLLQKIINYEDMDYVRDWAKHRSVATFTKQMEERNVAVFLNNNMQDNLFHSSNELNWYMDYKGPKKIMLSQGTHGQAEAGFLLLPVVMSQVWRDAFDFLDHHLKGVDNNIMTKSPVKMQLQTGINALLNQYLGFDSWPPTKGYNVLKYNLHHVTLLNGGYGTLVPAADGTGNKGVGSNTIRWTKNTKLNLGLPLITAALEPYVPYLANFGAVNNEYEIIFHTDVMTKRTRVCGEIVIEGLIATPSTNRFQLYAYAYDQPPKAFGVISDAVLIAHATRTEWVNATAGKPLGMPPMEFHVSCYDIEKGHRLAIGFNLHNFLYAGASKTTNTRVTLTYEKATISVPVLDI